MTPLANVKRRHAPVLDRQLLWTRFAIFASTSHDLAAGQPAEKVEP